MEALSRAWIKDSPPGMEYCALELNRSGLAASGVAIGTFPTPYRLEYQIETGDDWATSSFAAQVHADGRVRSLVLERDDVGRWTGARGGDAGPSGVDGVQPRELDPAVLDIDLQYSPVTNLMPVRRLGLSNVGATQQFTMAWISVPSLEIIRDDQCYTIVRPSPGQNLVRYESGDGEFVATITCDDDGVVIDYPGIARGF